MAYKFQLGAARLSGSLVQEGAAEVDALTADSLNVQNGGITNAGSIAGATSIDGSGDLTMGTITMTGFTVDADGDTALKSLLVDDGSTIGPDSVTDLITLAGAGDITIKDGAYDFDIAAHDGTNGLKLGGTLVQATAAQLNQLQSGEVSSVSEIFKTDLKIGEDNQTKIDFEDANKINFYANNSKEMVLEENELSPGTNDGIALGSASKGWSDLYLADSGEIKLGNDQDVRLIHAPDSGLILQTEQAGNTGVNLKMRHSSSSPADNDIIGAFEFAGYDDGGNETTFAGFSSKVTDVSNGSEDAGIQLDVMVNGSLVPGILDLGVTAAGVVTIKDGAYDFDVASHDGTNGLKLGGTLVTADAGELNHLDGIADAGYDATADSVVFFDATDSKLKYEAANDFAGALSGDGLAASSGVMGVGAGTGITVNANDVAVTAAQTGITSIYNSGLKIGYGASDAHIDFGTDNQIIMDIDNTVALTITSTGVTVAGNLIVSGDTVTQNVANMTVEDPLIGLGYTDSATGSAGDRGLLMGISGEQAPAMIWDESESQFAFVKTNSTLNATAVNINSYADLKVNSIEGSIVEAITSGSNTVTLSVGVNYFGDHGGAITANMPDNHSTVGQSVRVKAGSDCSATNKLTINAYGGQTIDGESEIVLESPYAAIEMVYIVSGSWRIF